MDAIEKALGAVVAAGELAGAVGLVWRDGAARAYPVGWRDIEAGLQMARDSIFRIASMSKPIVSAAALTLLEERRFSLEDPISRVAPEFMRMRVLQDPDGSLEDAVPADRQITFEDLLIGQNGRISYPFLGELAVAGKTLGALQNSLVEGLKPDYLLDPRISVSIVKYRPFFVNGEVRNPGGLPFQPGLTLRKAISLAGGFTERANTKEMMVIADNDPDHTERTVGLDYQVRPGDIITVKDTFF